MAKSQSRVTCLVMGMLVVLSVLGEVYPRAVQVEEYESTEQSEDQEVVDELHSFLPVREPASSTASTESPSNDDLCATIFCGNGRQCILKNGHPTCGCAMTCPSHYHPICGDDGVTYGNPCELHRAACLQNIKIRKHLRGPCPAPPPTPEPLIEEEKPLVCYEIERDQLRQLLIDWMKGRVQGDNNNNPGNSYVHVLTENFRSCDLDGDDQLSGFEFIQCVEKNETIADFQGMRPEEGHVLRGLCVDALILMSDTNEDWMLDLEEFLRCMDPNFEPPRKQCSLENKLYEDGAETRVDCNICVCACGNWVCSAMSCEEIDDFNLFEPYDVEQGPLPSKEERYALLRGFMAAEHVNLDKVEEEVPPPIPGSIHDPEVLPTPAEMPDTIPEHLSSDDLAPAFDGVDDLWPMITDENFNGQYGNNEHLSNSQLPSSKESVLGEFPRLPPIDHEEADSDEAFKAFLMSKTTTVKPDLHQQPEDTTTLATTTTTLQIPNEQNIHHQPPQRNSAPIIETPDQTEPKFIETPTPQPTPAPALPPVRRIIPVVSFNITVAEHRIIHTGDPEHAEEMSVTAERIQEGNHGTRHTNHDGHSHHSGKHHHHHHNSQGDHHSSHNNHHNTPERSDQHLENSRQDHALDQTA